MSRGNHSYVGNRVTGSAQNQIHTWALHRPMGEMINLVTNKYSTEQRYGSDSRYNHGRYNYNVVVEYVSSTTTIQIQPDTTWANLLTEAFPEGTPMMYLGRPVSDDTVFQFRVSSTWLMG